MKKFYLLLFLLVTICTSIRAQTAALYNFSSKTDISIDDISSGCGLLIPSNMDDATSAVIDLGFTFRFAGVSYTTFSVSSNGLFGLGSTPVDVNYWDYALVESLTYPILSAWSDDLHTASNGGVKYKLITESNGFKKLVVEWNVRSFSDKTSNLYNKTVQVWLLEGSDKIQFVYGAASGFIYNNATIGVAASNSDYVIVNSNNHTASTNNPFIINNNWPGAGLSYEFNPNSVSPADPIIVGNNTVTNVLCNGANNGAISLGTISGGDGQYNISWTGPNGFATGGSTLNNLYSGTYHYTITDNSSSSATGDVLVSQPTKLEASITSLSPASCGSGNDGSVTITATGGTSAYTFTLNNISNETGSFSNLASGNYTVNVKDANECTTTVQVTISQLSTAVASITASGPTSFCQGSSVSLTASAGTSYMWSNGATTQTILVNTSGEYSVQVSDANGCSATSSPVTTTVSAAPVASIAVGSDNDLLCSGLQLTAVSSETAASYSWSNGSTLSAIQLTNSNADGIYSVKVTDNNGCISNNATYTFAKQNILKSYSIVGISSVNLGSGTVVSKGSVGVTGATGTISLGSNSSVAAAGAVVKAKNITIQSPVNAPSLVYAPATIALPAVEKNINNAGSYGSYTASGSNITLTANYKSLVVKAGSSVTLTGNIFGSVTIESGSAVTFTSATVNVDKLIVSSSKASATTPLTYVRFAQSSAIRVSTSVAIYGRSRINDESLDVTFHCSDSNNDNETFTLNGLDTKVSANIYVPIGTLAVTGKDVSTTTNLNGLFIAQKITSAGTKVIWSSSDCTTSATSDASATTSIAASQQAVQTDELVQQPLASKFKVYPNLTSGQFNIRLGEGAGKKTSIIIFDNNGRPVLQKTMALTGEQIIRFDLTGKPAGMYIVKVMSEAGVQSARVFVQK